MWAFFLDESQQTKNMKGFDFSLSISIPSIGTWILIEHK
jgi:hypothetical protein